MLIGHIHMIPIDIMSRLARSSYFLYAVSMTVFNHPYLNISNYPFRHRTILLTSAELIDRVTITVFDYLTNHSIVEILGSMSFDCSGPGNGEDETIRTTPAGKVFHRFLHLPPELRIAIYEELLNPDVMRTDLVDGYSRYKFDLSLFYISKQIYQESKPVFEKNFHFVRIQKPWDEAHNHLQTEGHVPIIATGYISDSFQRCSLSITISAPESPSLDEQYKTMLLLADDLPLFCQMWFYSDLSYSAELNRHLKLTLTLRNPLGDAPGEELPFWVQKKLFQSFGLVKRLQEVHVEGPHSEKLEKTMREEMAVPEDSPEKCLEDATKLKEAGNQALKKGNPQLAVEMYIQAFKAIHIVCIGHYRGIWADTWFDKILRGGPFDQQGGQLVRLMLRIRLVANIVKAYLDMQNYIEALFWGERTIDIISRSIRSDDDHPLAGFPAATELGKIYYRTGFASKMLGKIYEARKHFRVAYTYLPRDEAVQRELASVSPMLG
jgi:tetratricopeptide (TPR) repeat protein